MYIEDTSSSFYCALPNESIQASFPELFMIYPLFTETSLMTGCHECMVAKKLQPCKEYGLHRVYRGVAEHCHR